MIYISSDTTSASGYCGELEFDTYLSEGDHHLQVNIVENGGTATLGTCSTEEWTISIYDDETFTNLVATECLSYGYTVLGTEHTSGCQLNDEGYWSWMWDGEMWELGWNAWGSSWGWHWGGWKWSEDWGYHFEWAWWHLVS